MMERKTLIVALTQQQREARRKQSDWNIRVEAMRQYGSHCQNCGESRIEVLCLDHINNDGAAHRALLKSRGGVDFYRKMKKLGWPKGLQVLCNNCNMSKQAFKRMPRQPRLLHLTRRMYGNVNVRPDPTVLPGLRVEAGAPRQSSFGPSWEVMGADN